MSVQKTTANKTLDLNRVKEIIFQDIDTLLDSFGLEYEQVADNIFMKCPVHEGSDNPQGVSISLTKQAWRCWTRGCHEHYNTDIFGFVKGVLDTDSFSDALRYVCKLYDVGDAKTKKEKEAVKKENPFGDLVSTVRKKQGSSPSASKFEEVKTLNGSPYFESRGFTRSTLDHFNVKDCSDRKCPMRYRSIIPIHFNGEQVGYIGRSTKGWLQPKYLFSNGIRKTDYLYNYDEAIDHARRMRVMFLVEGQGDVWKLYEAGVQNAISIFGKSLSFHQKKVLEKSGLTKLVVLTDNDQAGRESKIQIQRQMSRMFKVIFPRMIKKDVGDMTAHQIREDILPQLKGLY